VGLASSRRTAETLAGQELDAVATCLPALRSNMRRQNQSGRLISTGRSTFLFWRAVRDN
jgi:hypothetical protein